MSQHKKWIRFVLAFVIITLISVVVMYISVTNGTYDISPLEVYETIFGFDQNDAFDLVIFEFRLPRIIIGALVGFALGIAGAVLQGVTRNQLADPGILGIHAAAGMSIVLFMFFIQGTISGAGWFTLFNMSFFGWVGGMAAAMFLLLFSRTYGVMDPTKLILVGIASNSGFSAVTLYISLKMNPQDFEMATVWLSGSIYSASWDQIIAILPWIVIAVPIMMMKTSQLNALQFDDTTTVGIGVNQSRERTILLLCSVALISACVSVSGSIGFVGLIAPHIARRLVGINHLHILPISGLLGMFIVIFGDFIGKTIFAPAELPVGIVVSIIGVPYFIYLLIKARKIT
ncbi:FecCD family ABC transporter permease [Aquibacillus rhizosphaerae]|uniref:Iron ABC transporter permease n=1 Tax=Aquibacillus rhizosphaerae TaxID=3051431 RepID=A0ABT7L921_9BACI|nr:iron ABC transporter permease [Aquibacillus sp. LR5S19]MDL4842367.1 iron ABC transporter permease [Aquibacillus sp. LR5S19]